MDRLLINQAVGSIKVGEFETYSYDRVINDRSLWKIGFAVEVYSKGDEYWYPGQIIKIQDKQDVRFVDVIYNGKTKSLPVTSGDLKPLITDAKYQSQTTLYERFSKAEELLEKHQPKQEATTLDAFISYSQQDAQDAAALLQLLLKTHGLTIWLDSQEKDVAVSGMSKGIAMSRVFVIFLTKTYFERVFTIFELETAVALKKPIIVIWEGDERCGGYPDLKSHIDQCPNKYKAELFQDEAMKFERRIHLREAQVKVIAQRIQANTTKPTSCCRCSVL